MLAIGEELRAAREKKGLSLDQVADETNIARRYLGALESEDFSVFPGDPYIIGFLRNYAEYLGLEARDFVGAFKSMRIQEQPVPLERLIPARKKASPLLLVGLPLALVALAGAVYLVYDAVRDRAAASEARAAEAKREPETYELGAAPFERRVYPGDSLEVAFERRSYSVGVAAITDRVALETPGGVLRFMLGEEGTIDLDRDNLSDLLVFVADFSSGQADKGALLRIVASGALAQALAAAAPAGSATPGATAASPEAAVPTPAPAAAPASIAEAPPAGAKVTDIFTGNVTTYPFVLTGTFSNYAMFRYEVDRRDRDERYYRKGDTLTVNANNAIKIWTSNAGSARLTVQASGGKTAVLELGSPGEVAVKRIYWYRGEAGDWILAMSDVE